MRHRCRGRQLSVDSEHRTAMRRNLCVSLFLHGKITTTIAKAKEVRSMAEKLITFARGASRTAGDGRPVQSLAFRRRIISILGWRRTPLDTRRRRKAFGDEPRTEHESVLKVLIDDIGPRFADRTGGYTRILHLAERRMGDGGEQAVLELLPKDEEKKGASVSRVKRARHRRAEGLEAVRKKREQRRASNAAQQQSKAASAAQAAAAEPAKTDAPAPAAEGGSGAPPAGEQKSS